MGEILQNWLATRLGIILDMKPSILGKHMQDGVLFAKLLHSYNVINAELLKEIIPTEDPEMQLKNVMKLKIWFHYIGIKCDDSVFQDISEGKGDTAKKLIYHMFLCLENKDKIHFISQTYHRGASSDTRFEVKKVPESVFSESRSNEVDSKKLQEDEYLTDFFSKKYQEILNLCTLYRVESRREVENEVERIFRAGVKGESVYDWKASQDVELNFREGLEQRKSASSLEEEKASSESSSKEPVIPDGFIKFTPMQKVDRKAEQVYAERINKLILSELWHKIMKLQEKQMDNVIAKKLVKQSQYEKQIATKLMLIRNEKKIMAENRQIVEKLILEKREEEYNNAIALCSELEKGRGGRQFENERTLELHERIESAKKRSDYEKNCLMSKDIMEAIADIAIQISEYKKANEGIIPPKVISEWKALFFKSQPIYETVDVEDIIIPGQLTDEHDAAQVEAEIERQNVINDHNLQEYLDLEGPWDLEQLCPDLQRTEGTQMVLGYIVHRLLELKYPYPPPPVPADLPEVSVAAVLIGASEPKVVTCLKELLMKRAIQVISVENIISDCVETYKQESTPASAEESAGLSAVDDTHAKKGDKHGSSGKNGRGSKKMSADKKKMSLKGGLEDEESMNKDEQTQTPAVLPEEEEQPPSLSAKGELGKRAFEYLSEGKRISDDDLIDMIIEYLKEQKDIGGWIILDYPSTYEQSRLFEVKISGKEMPVVEEKGDKMEIVKFEDRSLESKLAAELEMKKRTSRLVPNPIKRPEKEPFATCLTAYINARKKDMEYFSKTDDDFEICDDDTSPLDYIYADQGVNYSFYYKSFDFPTIKRLARIIIGDMELPPKPSHELFGDTFEDIERNLFPESKTKPSASKRKLTHKTKAVSEIDTHSEPTSVQIKETKELGVSPEESLEDKKKHKGGKQKDKKADSRSESEIGKKGKPVLQEQEDEKKEETNEDDETEAKDGGSKKPKQTEDKDIPEEVPIYKPGEEGWEYVSLGLQEGMDIALAELWENVEEVYTKDFKEIFFLKRIQESIVIPYVNFVKDSIQKFISRPDNKQEILSDFQIQYNGMDEDLRQDVEVKNELHCRVSELRNVLWDICDSRKVEAENERKRIISELWLMYEMTCLVNLYVASVQLEIDRCADTLQILNDYYISMLNKVPPPVRLEKCLLPRLELGDKESSDTGDVLEVKVDLKQEPKPEGRTAKRLKSDAAAAGSTRPAAMREAVTKLLTTEQDTVLLLPFNTFINDTNKVATTQVEGYNTIARDVISKEDDATGTKKSIGKAKRASSKGKKSVSVALLPSEAKDKLEPNRLIIEEWTAAAQGEVSRALFRLQILKARIVADLTELQNKVQEIFYRMHKAIGIRYEHEVESVDRLCCLLCNAIEEEVRIQPELVLDGERFYVRSDVFMYPEPPPPEPPPLAERITPTEFRVQQLQLLFSKFSRMGPQGLLPERAFVFTIQDLLLCNIELGDVKPLPKSWNELFSGDVQVLVEQIFGKSEFVDWKDFLLHGLDLPYPTQIDILNTRDQFLLYDLDHKETVSEDEYMRVKFWYERDLPDDPQYCLRVQMAKEFLFKLFQVPHMLLINYSALLLAFCKDDDPIEGFCKALALVTGKRVPYPIEEEKLEEMQDALLSEVDSEKRKEAENVADMMIDHVVEGTIQSVMGITIHEVDDEGQEIKPQYSERAVEVTNFDVSSKETSSNRLDVPPSTPEWMSDTHLSPYMYEELQTVTFVLVLSILTTRIPWHARFPPFIVTSMASMHEALRDVFEGEDCISVKQFLEHPFLTTLTSEVYCFKKCSMAELVEKIVNSKADFNRPLK